MKNYARIEDGVVAELFSTDGDISQMFPPSLIWVDVGDSAPAVGWLFADGIFSAPPAPAPPPFAPIATEYLNTVRAIREQALNRLTGIGFFAMFGGDTATAQAAATARQALLDITKAPAVLAATDASALKAAVLAAYGAIVAAAPASLVAAFDAAGL